MRPAARINHKCLHRGGESHPHSHKFAVAMHVHFCRSCVEFEICMHITQCCAIGRLPSQVCHTLEASTARTHRIVAVEATRLCFLQDELDMRSRRSRMRAWMWCLRRAALAVKHACAVLVVKGIPIGDDQLLQIHRTMYSGNIFRKTCRTNRRPSASNVDSVNNNTFRKSVPDLETPLVGFASWLRQR